MERIRLTSRDGWILAACFVVFAVSLWVGVTYFHRAFPEASIDFQTTRQSSLPIAAEALAHQKLTPPSDYRHAASFGYDYQAKVYLEREIGLDSAQQYLGDPIQLWAWRHRWFKPSTKEEFRAEISPAGDLVALHHLVEEDADGADLPRDSALTLARAFLYGSMNIDSATVELIEGSRTGRPNRSDWTFTWRLKHFEPAEGSDYRYEVEILGDQIGGFDQYLRVPEAWQADYKRMRSLNNLAGGVDSVFMVLTLIAIVAVFFVRIKKADIQWKTAIWFGAVAAVLSYLNNLNSLPQELYYYDTTTSWSGFLLQKLLLGLLLSLGVGVLIGVLTASAEALYRQRYPEKVGVPRLFTLRGMRTRSSFIAITVGITMTAFFFAYQVIFYITANHFGGWSPADVPYDNLLNTAFPWVAVLFIGFMPAVSEEFMSRMFSIPFLQNVFKGRATWLALLIPAFIWGFGHATYPNQPFWIRGVEVGIAGVIVGVIMLRFGILATLVWHYTVDALYTAFLLFRSHNTYFIITAAVASGLLLIPFLLALAAYLRTGTFAPEAGLRNEDLSAPAEAPEEKAPHFQPAPHHAVVEPSESYVPMGVIGRIVAILLFIAGILVAKPERVGDYLDYSVARSQAAGLFADSLRASGWANPDTLLVDAFPPDPGSGPAVYEAYLLKQLGSVDALNDLLGRERPATWTVHAWSRENRLRFLGAVEGSSGRVVYVGVRMPEEMPGDSLSVDSAQALATDALMRVGVDLDSLVLQNTQEDARPHRMDYVFTWEAPEGDPRNIGEAKFRHFAEVKGSYVSTSPRPFYKIPESWSRDRQASTTTRTARKILIIGLFAMLVGYGITLLVVRTRQDQVPWKRAFTLAILPALIAFTAVPGFLHAIKDQYFNSVELAWNVFLMSGVLGLVVTLAFLYILFAMVLALLGTLYSDRRAQLSARQRRSEVLDGIATGVAAMGAWILGAKLIGWLGVTLPGWLPMTGIDVPSWLGAPFAAGMLLESSLIRAALIAGFFGLASHLWRGPMRKSGLRVLLAAGLVFMLQDMQAVEPREWLFSMMGSALALLLAWAVLTWVVRGRALRFFVAVWVVVVYPRAVEAIFGVHNASARTQGIFFLVIALALMVFWLMGLGGSKKDKPIKTIHPISQN